MKNRFARLLLLLAFAVPAQADRGWGYFFEELQISELVHRFSRSAHPETLAFIGVNVIPMTPGTAVLSDYTVVVRDGRIAAAGPRASVAIPKGARRIDARGKFLFPGLTDAHVHTLETDSGFFLNLFNGITAVREMDGFPWLLADRAAIRANRVLAPTPYVAGTILNYFPMGWYAVPVKSVAQARQVVRDQKAAGYDFIKVHNVMPLPFYDAILETAREEHIRVVGHVPHEVTASHAITAGQYTLEHLKGFYLDTSLEMAKDDWLGAVRGADVWICPTLVTRLGALSSAETEAFMKSSEGAFISARARRTWPDKVKENATAVARVWELSQTIFKQLLPVTDRFIAGTDSGGGYANSVPGFALHDELETMERLGMATAQVLRTATINAAVSLGDPASFGTIEPGRRADLVLLDRNPLEGVKNLRDPRGVVVRGIWLDYQTLASMREGVRSIYARAAADASLDGPSSRQIGQLLRRMQTLHADGWVFRDHQMEELADLLIAAKRPEDAARVRGFATSAKP